MRYGELVYRLRVNRNMSQEKLAQGISSQPTLSRFEAGEAYVPAETLIQYMKRLCINPTEFFTMVEDETLNEYQYFYQLYESATRHKADKDTLMERELDLFNKTNDQTFFINAILIRLTYAKKNSESLEKYKRDIDWVLDYFGKLEYWHLRDLEMYVSLVFVFASGRVRKNHLKMTLLIENSVFSEKQKKKLRFSYAHNVIILMFERLYLQDIPLYLHELDKSISNDSEDLDRSFVYSVFSQLYQLTQSFSEIKLLELLMEIKILRKYHYADNYHFHRNLVLSTLSRLELINVDDYNK